MQHGKIRIWLNGNPLESKVAVVDADGKETDLLVERISLDMTADHREKHWLRLGLCYGNVLELEIPTDGSIMTKLVERAGPSSLDRKFAVVVDGDPLAEILPGLYELQFTDGTTSLAAVGADPDHGPWFAPVSRGAVMRHGPAAWDTVAGAIAVSPERKVE